MGRVYPDIEPGQWVQPQRKGYRLRCCDCQLVHVVNIRIVKGRVQWQMFRDNRATAAIRRKRAT